MTNRDVIEIINRAMSPEATKFAFSASEVFTAIIHGYYYIRPGKNRSKFLKKINKILADNWKDRSKMDTETKDGLSFEVYLLGKMAGEALFVARSMFDEEYYASQIQLMPTHEEYDDSLLERYLYRLSDEELKTVFEGILTFKGEMDAFISDDKFDDMMEELEARSIKVIENDPWYMRDYDKHLAKIDNDWDFCFEYLCRESIIDVICRHIDEDPVMLASMIKTLKYSDVRSAAEYTVLAFELYYGYEVDIFDPFRTDPNGFEDEDAEQQWKVRSKTVGKMTFSVKSL